MKKLVCLTLGFVILCAPLPTVSAQEPAVGSISGLAASTTGARLSGVTMQAVNAAGSVVGTAVTTKEGEFTIAGIAVGTYTVQCVNSNGSVLGTTSIALTTAMATVKVTCFTDPAAIVLRRRPSALLAGLGAAAVAIGAIAVVSFRGDASGAR